MRNYQKSDFKKGQKVYLYVTGNEARRTKPGIENRIREAVVKTVGRKYITVGYPNRQYFEAKFEIDNDFRQFYETGTIDFVLYLTKEEIYEDLRIGQLQKYIRDEIHTDSVMSKITKEDLEKIADIVSKYTTKEKPNLDFSHKTM